VIKQQQRNINCELYYQFSGSATAGLRERWHVTPCQHPQLQQMPATHDVTPPRFKQNSAEERRTFSS
jgi:hypothetical protein